MNELISTSKKLKAIGVAIAVSLPLTISISACSGGSSTSPISPPPLPPTASIDPIPRLSPGPHLGYIEGFDDLSPKAGEPDRAARASDLRATAIAAGMSIGRAQIDWGELETAPGVFDDDALEAALIKAGRDGMAIFVTLSTVDISELTIPSDLLGPDNLLPPGKKLDDPEITIRFNAFLDWFVPRMTAHNVWGLAIGNEVDGIVNDGILTSSEVLAHLLGGVNRVNQLDSDIAVTVTLTGDSNRNVPQFTNDLIAGLDIVSFNTYCLRDDLTVSTPAAWVDVLTRWRQTAGNKQIFIQELGCPIGYGDDGVGAPVRPANGLGGSTDIQADFFAYYIDQFATDDQLRAATVFQLYDWSPELAKTFNDIFTAAGDPLSGARLEEWLATVGLCRWSDATCRPSWDTVLQGMDRLQTVRTNQ